MSASLLFGLAVAESTGATTPGDTVAETRVAGTPETVVETSGDAAPLAAVEILPPDEPWGGATRGEWDARSWQQAVSMPVDVGMRDDTTGERCGYGQFGPVFFLPGGVEAEGREITCVVAEGTAIYVGVAGGECSTVEPAPFFGRTEDELRACAGAWLDEATDFQARVDGQDVENLDAYRISSPLFTLNFPENNTFGVEPGVAEAVSEGYSFIIAPPPPGQYQIAVSVTFPRAPGPYAITVNLIVEAPQVIEPPTT